MDFGLSGPSEMSVIERCPYYSGVRKLGEVSLKSISELL